MSHNNIPVSSLFDVQEAREERRRTASQETGASIPQHRSAPVASTKIPAARFPGAEAVPGPDYDPRLDDETVVYSTANESTELPIPSPVVDKAEENRMLNEETRILIEENRVIRERQQIRQGENAIGDAQDHDDENEEICCGCSKGCRRITIVAGVVLVLLAVAVIVPLVLTQMSGPPTTPGSQTTPAPSPATPVPTAPPNPTAPTPPPQDLIDFLSSVSSDGGDAISTPGTPQNQALEWLADDTNLASYSDDKKKQRYALAVLYFSTNGETWTNRDNWLDYGEECDRWWQHERPLQCTDSGAVLVFLMHANNLQGTVPPETGLFSESLEIMDFHGNSISGLIPNDIGRLANLEYLSLEGNDVSGTIPSDIGLLTKLTRWLSFHDNQLSGTIPSSLANLTNLEGLGLSNNQLTGTIPAFFENLTKLDGLYLYGNQFTGTFTCPEFIPTCYISCEDDTDECRTL